MIHTNIMKDIIITFNAWCYRQQKHGNLDLYDKDEIVNNYMWENNLYGQEIYDALMGELNNFE